MQKKKPLFRFEEIDIKHKDNKTKIYIAGWVHDNDYKIIVRKKHSKKVLFETKGSESKYDICLFFDEPIEDNKYGFSKKETVEGTLKEMDIYIKIGDKEKIGFRVRDNLLHNAKEKIFKIFKMIFKAIRLFWREYHFLVPPSMLKKYFLDFKNRLKNIKNENSKCYNQDINEEYHEWINHYEICKKKTNVNELTFINIDETGDILKCLKKVDKEYICVYTNNVIINNNFGFYVNESLKEKPDFIYSDSDMLIDNERQKPLFKPDWSPDTILGANYIGELFIIKTDIFRANITNKDLKNIYNYILKTVFKCKKIKHIDKILYHEKERNVNQDENYDIVENYLGKGNVDIVKNPDKETLTIEYRLKNSPLVSIIIPTKDAPQILETCLKSIYQKSTYKNFEIVLIDNNSVAETTFKLFDEYKEKHDNFNVVRLECPFNYSYINNEAIKKYAKGEYVVLLNNDTEIITPNWIELMLGYAMQEHVGIVGAKLLFEDNTLQHAGLIIGKGGLAGHSHYGEERYLKSTQWELRMPYNVSGNTAACILVNKEKILEVGCLEEKLAVAFNDVDLNLKFLEKGYYNIYLPMVELYHYESKSRGLDSTPEKQKRFMQEWKFMNDKWGKKLKYDAYYNSNFSRECDYKLDASKEVLNDE